MALNVRLEQTGNNICVNYGTAYLPTLSLVGLLKPNFFLKLGYELLEPVLNRFRIVTSRAKACTVENGRLSIRYGRVLEGWEEGDCNLIPDCIGACPYRPFSNARCIGS